LLSAARLLTLLFALAFSGCGGNNQVGGQSDPNNEISTQPGPEKPSTDPPNEPQPDCRLSGTAFEISPARDANDIPATRPIRIALGDALKPDALAQGATAVSLSDMDGNEVAIDIHLKKTDCLIEIVPQKPLRGGTRYRLNVDLAQLTGKEMENDSSVEQYFTTMDMRFLGASFFNSQITSIEQLTRTDLLGVLRFGGRWVTELALPEKNPDIIVPDSYLAALDHFCNYATGRDQRSVIQIPVFLPSAGIREALAYLQQREDHCNLLLFAIGNEVDRMDSDEEQYADSYEWPDYFAALKRIVPLLRAYFPDAAITALDLSSFEEYNDYQALRDWVDPFCASDDPAVRQVDFLSVHFYPYTGAQKQWDMLGMGKQFDDNLRQLPQDCPPLLLGEYNTTYQWRAGSTYPGSGGDAFMTLLTLPEILRQEKTVGLLHWSLIEEDTSTLGLFQPPGMAAKAIYPGYLLLMPVKNSMPVAATTTLDTLAPSAFDADGTLHLYLGNYKPLWRRNITVGNSTSAQVMIDQPNLSPLTVAALPPFSLTYLQLDPASGLLKQQRISFENQNISDGPLPSADNRHCITVADFSEPNKEGADFISQDYNQNLKIATGGTPLAITFFPNQPSVQMGEMASLLELRCHPATERKACGVSLPLLADTATTKSVDWSEGSETASFRLTLSNPEQTAVSLQLQLGMNHPATADDIENDMAVALSIPGGQTVQRDVPWSSFAQPATTPATQVQTLQATLSRLAALRVMLANPDTSGTIQIRQVEICDRRVAE